MANKIDIVNTFLSIIDVEAKPVDLAKGEISYFEKDKGQLPKHL